MYFMYITENLCSIGLQARVFVYFTPRSWYYAYTAVGIVRQDLGLAYCIQRYRLYNDMTLLQNSIVITRVDWYIIFICCFIRKH